MYDGITDTRRRTQKNHDENVPLKAFVQARTPRGVPLILSPLGQTHDRYIGAIHNAGRMTDPVVSANPPYFTAETIPLSSTLVAKEDIQVKKCALMSAIRNCANKAKVLRVTCAEWQKLADQSENAVVKARLLYEATLAASQNEALSIYQKLVDCGLQTQSDLSSPDSESFVPALAEEIPKKPANNKKGGTKKR